MPHMRGDEPVYGCNGELIDYVCPTCVGMNRCASSNWIMSSGMPHMRGDEPISETAARAFVEYAPTCVGNVFK